MAVFLWVLAGLGGASCFGQPPPPPNDNFADRIPLTGSRFTWTGDASGASIEWEGWEVSCYEDDRNVACSHASIWWSWTPQEDSPVIIERIGDCRFREGYLAVYATTNLYWGVKTQLVCGINLGTPGQYAVFTAKAGTNYAITLACDETYGDKPGPETFRLSATNVPIFRLQPRTQTVSSGDSALFTASAVGIKPFTYQWRHEGTNVTDATGQQLPIHNVGQEQAGNYCVVVSSATGTSTSAVARLLVSAPLVGPRLTALGPVAGKKFQLVVDGEEGRTYVAEFSRDLKSWISPGCIRPTLLNTNAITTFQLPMDDPAKFIRLTPHHAVSEVCNCNLKMIRFAIWQLAEEKHLVGTDAAAGFMLVPCFAGGQLPYCPADPARAYFSSYSICDVQTIPCCITDGGHFYEGP